MPRISLVVCLYAQRSLLERLLSLTTDCYDDLVVVHDGLEESKTASSKSPLPIEYGDVLPGAPLPAGYDSPAGTQVAGRVAELVLSHDGRFFEGSRCDQQEAHWPFAWWQARHDWILRLDADEVPRQELREWLRAFRELPEPDAAISGYTCIWPLWDGHEIITQKWPNQRLFLFHRERVRFFGLPEQTPIPDQRFETLPLTLEHKPMRKSYGLQNLLVRPQAYAWRRMIARSLLGSPIDLPRWRWSSPEWPFVWQEIREAPLRTGLKRLFGWPIRTAQQMWRVEGRVVLSAAATSGIHHCLIAFAYWRERARAKR